MPRFFFSTPGARVRAAAGALALAAASPAVLAQGVAYVSSEKDSALTVIDLATLSFSLET